MDPGHVILINVFWNFNRNAHICVIETFLNQLLIFLYFFSRSLHSGFRFWITATSRSAHFIYDAVVVAIGLPMGRALGTAQTLLGDMGNDNVFTVGKSKQVMIYNIRSFTSSFFQSSKLITCFWELHFHEFFKPLHFHEFLKTVFFHALLETL